MNKTILIVLVAVIIIAVGGYFGIKRFTNIKTSMSTPLDFTVSLLPKEEMKNKYVMMEYTLSPFPEYHFKLALGKDWKTVDTALTKQIVEGDTTLHTVGLFQKRDNGKNPVAEIEVVVANLPIDTPLLSLKDLVKEQYGSKLLVIDNYRAVGETGQDILFTFKHEAGGVVATRMFAFKNLDGRVFAISGSASIGSYNQFAQDFYTAMATFSPIAN